MKTLPSSRRGSALLLVLGMLAFMIVSAVGFSAYMRYSRLPSSYLRRNNASRHLAKAAVARAIEAIDRAIGNNPHPNVGGGTENRWVDRVFTGSVSTNGSVLINETVTPLCLEALAYIPPALVNEARYYSRRVPSCCWKSFPFDVGRYSYLALDVSDYFDVNRLMADTPRSSSPERRISIAYLFENVNHSQLLAGAEEWDTFMEQFRRYDEETLRLDFESKYPLISIADLNLTLGAKGTVGLFWSPFYEYITSGGSARAGFYNTQSREDEEKLRRMTFVTDGWFPAGREDWKAKDEDDDTEVYDITDGRYQPFAAAHLSGDTPPSPASLILGQAGYLNANDKMRWLDHLSGLGVAALFDYLDTDRYPLALSIPTCERVPMIAGISPRLSQPKLQIEKTYEPASDVKVSQQAGKTRTAEKTVHYRLAADPLIRSLMGGWVETLVAFPFARPDAEDDGFTVDGRLALFFADAGLGLRTYNKDDVLHLDDTTLKTEITHDGVISMALEETPVSFQQKPKSEEDAVKLVKLRFKGSNQLQAGLKSRDILKVVYRWKQTKPEKGDWTPSFDEVLKRNKAEDIAEAECSLPALDKDGIPDGDLSSPEKVLSLVRSAGSKNLSLNAAVWLRVRKGDRVVDMVPACLDDDKIQNGTSVPLQLSLLGRDQFVGNPFPLMRFDTGKTFAYSVAGLESLVDAAADFAFDPETVIVSDPRFNYAPEHWYKSPVATLSAADWLEHNQTGVGGRDGDIFMSTSDAGYLQSPAEIAFLPALTDLYECGNRTSCGNLDPPDSAQKTKIPSSFGNTVNQAFMWKTYDLWGTHAQAFSDLPWSSEGTGYKITPYSDSTNILMSVFANTPIDWRRASTNVVGDTDYATMSAKEFNSEFAMNAYSSGARVTWNDLTRVAARYHALLRGTGVSDWRDCWNKMGWEYDPSEPGRFCAFEMDNASDTLWTADRKFLYGFWRDCFGVSQQLFLIFVRAEPMMMGSGSPGVIPPQMGARAVALVWRDPHKGKVPNLPHQTRVLFYRQFD